LAIWLFGLQPPREVDTLFGGRSGGCDRCCILDCPTSLEDRAKALYSVSNELCHECVASVNRFCRRRVIILLIINCTMLGKGVLGLFNPSDMIRLPLNAWTFIALAGFVGGFAERLVPSLLQSLDRQSSKAGDNRGSPKKTHSKGTPYPESAGAEFAGRTGFD
jgi:hypothetical protein